MKLLAYAYYIFNTIVVCITTYMVMLFDCDTTPIECYIVAFLGVIWCGVNVFIYELNKRREEVRKHAKIRRYNS